MSGTAGQPGWDETILIVDDSYANLKLLRDVLEDAGYRVRPASDGELALRSTAVQPPTLILLDIKMPGIDGFEVLRRLKADQASSRIPVIFLSASVETVDLVRGLSLGALDFIVKPFQKEELLARVRIHLELVRLQNHLETLVAQRTAQLEAANRELEELSYSMSHDMRTPLRAIGGFARILLDEQAAKLDDEGKRLLNAVRDNAQHMGILIDDILRFLSLGRLKLEYAPVDLAKLAQEASEVLRTAEPARRLRLDIQALPPAWGDHGMLRQVLLNLLSNAVKFSPGEGETLIEMGGTTATAENIYYVKDHGVGFDMRYAGKLFKVFERLHPTGQYAGSGVGLAIVKRIVERHGGRVWAEAQIDAGATFYFTLPRSDRRSKSSQ